MVVQSHLSLSPTYINYMNVLTVPGKWKSRLTGKIDDGEGSAPHVRSQANA